MSKPEFPTGLLEVLRGLMAWFEEGGIRGVVIGGVAASLLGRPRVTRDVDALVLVEEGQWGSFLAGGAQFGFLPRRPDALRFARKSRVLLARHQATGIDVDIVLGALPLEQETVSRAQAVKVSGVAVSVPTPEDLIIMKAFANRPRDVADIESLLDSHPRVDLRRVRRWVGELAATVEMPEILENFESILAKWRIQKKG